MFQNHSQLSALARELLHGLALAWRQQASVVLFLGALLGLLLGWSGTALGLDFKGQ